MTARDSRSRYLERRADFERRPLEGKRVDAPKCAVVIPALAELEELPRTLESLAGNSAAKLDSTQVIVVVNNRTREHGEAGPIAENLETLRELRAGSLVSADAGSNLAWVDASSPGLELNAKEGVGTARKIGLDWGLQLFGDRDGALVWLDADTRVESNYLDAIHAHFENPEASGAVLAYAHEMPADERQRLAIIEYESFLGLHALGLRQAGSPYAAHTIGSTIACSAEAYVAAGGMNRRPAAEDFYFVQQLVKTGRVAEISDTVVHPSARPSQRVHLGTGFRITERLREPASAPPTAYHPQVYAVLGQWLEAVRAEIDGSSAELLNLAESIEPDLRTYLDEHGFGTIWDGLLKQHRAPGNRLRAFHVWFDGLRTLRLIHWLRDRRFPNCALGESAARLLDEGSSSNPETVLDALRGLSLPPLLPIDGGI